MNIVIREVSTIEERSFAENLLVSSFPLNERPAISILRLRPTSVYHLSVIESKGVGLPVGILGYWDFSTSHYIEHFAIAPKMQGKGYGSAAFAHILDSMPGQVFCEVEPPVDTTTQRRVNFYTRLGFRANPQPYFMPDYYKWKDGKKELDPMLIFSKTPLSDVEFQALKTELYKKVYNFDEALQRFDI